MAISDDAELIGDLIRHFIHAGARAEADGRFAEAETIYRAWIAALPQDPRAKYSLGLLLLANGDYAEGFHLYQYRLMIPELGISGPSPTLIGRYADRMITVPSGCFDEVDPDAARRSGAAVSA